MHVQKPVSDARRLITEHIAPLPVEYTPLLQAQGRVLASSVQTLVVTGQTLTPSRIALLTSVGKTHVLVHAPARVAIVAPEDADESVVTALMALTTEAGGWPFRLPLPRDRAPQVLKQALALDVVLVVGKGLAPLIAAQGTVHFTHLPQEPGGNFAFATLENRPVFGMPEDLAGVMVDFEVHVRPALRRMLGHQAQHRPHVIAQAEDTWGRQPGVEAFMPAWVLKRPTGYTARLADPESPFSPLALARANGFLLLPPESTGFAAGDRLETILLEPHEICGMACLPIGGDASVTRWALKP